MDLRQGQQQQQHQLEQLQVQGHHRRAVALLGVRV